MLKDYKNEIEEILVADKQLQKEILYDMQKHDAAIARAKVAAAAAAIPAHREALQQVTPGVTRTPAPASVPVPATVKQFSKGKNLVDDDAQQQARGTMGGKENEIPDSSLCSNPPSVQPFTRNTRQSAGKGPAILTRTPAFSSLKKAGVGNSRAGPSAHVNWQNQKTPRRQIYSAMPSGLSRMQWSESRPTPFGPSHPHTSQIHIRTPRRPAEEPSHPVCHSHEETHLAGAVADVAAASTVATVLQQVAQRSVTPFKAMSIPRLRPDISRISSVLRQQQSTSHEEILKDDRPVQTSSNGGDGLETVRRRQSFSSVDEPCGQLSQSGSEENVRRKK